MDFWCFSLNCEEGWNVFYSAQLDAQTAKNLKLSLDDILAEMGWTTRVDNLRELKEFDSAKFIRLARGLDRWNAILIEIESGLQPDSDDASRCFEAYTICVEQLQYLRAKLSTFPDNPLRQPTREPAGKAKAQSIDDEAAVADADGTSVYAWFTSNPDGEYGERYKFGSISGHLKQLAQWISQDQRTLCKYNGTSFYYIRRVHSRSYEVWFESEAWLQKVMRKINAEPDQNDSSEMA
jgi:hypothetical protein